MPAQRPRLPSADDLPEIEVDDDDLDGALSVDMEPAARMSAEADVSETLEDIAVQSFEEDPQQGPLNFHDGGVMGRPKG